MLQQWKLILHIVFLKDWTTNAARIDTHPLHEHCFKGNQLKHVLMTDLQTQAEPTNLTWKMISLHSVSDQTSSTACCRRSLIALDAGRELAQKAFRAVVQDNAEEPLKLLENSPKLPKLLPALTRSCAGFLKRRLCAGMRRMEVVNHFWKWPWSDRCLSLEKTRSTAPWVARSSCVLISGRPKMQIAQTKLDPFCPCWGSIGLKQRLGFHYRLICDFFELWRP